MEDSLLEDKRAFLSNSKSLNSLFNSTKVEGTFSPSDRSLNGRSSNSKNLDRYFPPELAQVEENQIQSSLEDRQSPLEYRQPSTLSAALIGPINVYSGGRHPIKLNDTTYMIGDKLTTTLRQTYINWNAFLEIYHDSIDDDNLFQQVVNMFNLNTTEKLKPHITKVLHKIYHLSSLHHISCMIKQFVIKEPISMAIYNIFKIFKQYFESLVMKFLIERNQYIQRYNLQIEGKVQLNQIEYLQDKWNSLNDEHSYDTSSHILYFISHPHKDATVFYNILPINKSDSSTSTSTSTSVQPQSSVSSVYTPYAPPVNSLKYSDINQKKHKETFKKIQSAINNLVEKVKQFEYVGFCPKKPLDRLMSLLKFPVNNFHEVLLLLSDDFHPVDMKKLFNDIRMHLVSVEKPVIKEIKERSQLPKNLSHHEQICWYVKAILDLRKSLLSEGQKIERYYMKFAHILSRILDIVKKYIVV